MITYWKFEELEDARIPYHPIHQDRTRKGGAKHGHLMAFYWHRFQIGGDHSQTMTGWKRRADNRASLESGKPVPRKRAV